MDRLIFTSGATVKEMANTRQILINELANVSTVGFKGSFGTALNSIKAEGNGGSFDTRVQVQTVTRDQIRLQPGAVMATGRDLDVAMTNQSVMQVQAPNGERAFTRRGDLRVNALGQLETGSGHLVMGQGGPINMPPGMMVSINGDGTVFAQDLTQGTAAPPIQVDQIALRDASEVVLTRRADGLFQVAEQPPGSDFASGPNMPGLIPKALEGSNVSAIEAMARLMDQSRSFETQIKIIKETKQLDEQSSSMLKA